MRSTSIEDMSVDSIMEVGMDRVWNNLHRLGLDTARVMNRLQDTWGGDLADQYKEWLES